MNEQTRVKRLYFRSHHRGSKETDLILGAHADAYLEQMNKAELDEFEAFLEENDNDIWDWVSGKSAPQDNRYPRLLATLKARYAIKG